jgi:hypothetical protein
VFDCDYNEPLEHYDCGGNCIAVDENLVNGLDCAGVCGGDLIDDECGECGGDNSSCADCAGVPNGNTEIETYYIDGDADGLGSADFSIEFCVADDPDGWVTNGSDIDDDCECIANDETCYDCNGECGGDLIDDECGVCGGDNSSCSDCEGVPNGDSWLSACGCVPADNTGDECDDCFGVPDGTAWESDCGCVPDGNSGDDCDDCAGIPGGTSIIDDCEMCVQEGDMSCEQDCAGEWGGDAVMDECGICFLRLHTTQYKYHIHPYQIGPIVLLDNLLHYQ